MNKIFIYLIEDDPGFSVATALGDDGVMITAHLSTSHYWAEVDMGLTPEHSSKHAVYQRHFPNGYTLVNLIRATEDELRANEEFMAALDRYAEHASDNPLPNRDELSS